MPTTPTGNTGLAIDAVGETLKQYASWLAFTGTATAELAKARVYPWRARTWTRPCVFVELMNVVATGGAFRVSTARLIFERDTDAAYAFPDGAEKEDEASGAYAFLNLLDPVIDSLATDNASGGVEVTGLRSEMVVARSARDNPDDYHTAVWMLEFGIGSE